MPRFADAVVWNVVGKSWHQLKTLDLTLNMIQGVMRMTTWHQVCWKWHTYVRLVMSMLNIEFIAVLANLMAGIVSDTISLAHVWVMTSFFHEHANGFAYNPERYAWLNPRMFLRIAWDHHILGSWKHSAESPCLLWYFVVMEMCSNMCLRLVSSGRTCISLFENP